MTAIMILRWLMEEEQKWGNTQFTTAKYDEAIAELEALDNRSCYECNNLQALKQADGFTGAYCPYFGDCKEETHLESHWEAKQ